MLTQEERSSAIQYALNGATFMFIPSFQLCNLIISDAPEIKNVNKILRIVILKGKPIRMESDMIIRYCNGILDSKNSWLLDHGDIKVVPKNLEI